jgi:putative ABC transport system ATP-binding protein
MSAVLTVRDLTKTYGDGELAVDAVRHVDLDVDRGEVVLVMGPSGSGKTTLLLMLGAMLRPTSGSVLVDGTDVAVADERSLPPLRARRFGFVFQDFNLLTALSAVENVELACNLAGITGRAARRRATALLTRLGLEHRLHFRPAHLSGGEKQRVAIARALANDAPVILADEPTANLDSGHGREIARILRSLASEDGRSVVIVSHDQRLKEIADRILWLEDGRFRELAALATDPVCLMAVDTDEALRAEWDRQVLWFCGPRCRDEFAASPERFVGGAPVARAHLAADRVRGRRVRAGTPAATRRPSLRGGSGPPPGGQRGA